MALVSAAMETSSFFADDLAGSDPEIAAAVAKELGRQ